MSEKEHTSLWGTFFGIKTKLIGAFLIPVFFIILLGTLSTKRASEVIIANYKEATESTVQKTGEYYNILLQMADAKSKELAESSDVRNYYGGAYAETAAKENDVYNQISSKTKAIVSSDANLNLACILSAYGRNTSTVAAIQPGKYEELLETPEGQQILAGNGEGIWSGHHTIVDEALMQKDSQYGLSVSRQVISNQLKPVAVVVLDIAMEALQEPLKSLAFPEGSICVFMTPDGREITAEGEHKEKIFYNQSFYADAVKGEQTKGLRELEYQGEDYLYIYSKIGKTGSMICALIPKSMLTAQTDGIKSMTNMIVLIAIFIAVVTGLILAANIGSTINKMNKLVKRAADGDLTVHTVNKRKDEFGVLSKHLSGMLAGMKVLIQRAANVAYSIFDSAKTVADASGKMVETSKGISKVIEQMESGLEVQATDAKQCLDKMGVLEEKIEEVYTGTEQITQFIGNTIKVAADGLKTVGELEEKSKETSEITHQVIQNIEELEGKSQKIGGIAATINDIADETNLLSLNASIEAARAGESGRGFGVVAEEIGKLAAASMKASKQIDGIIMEIQKMTENTSLTAKKAETIVSSQEMALANTISAFSNITEHVGGLNDNISIITSGISDIREAKNVTMEAVENITSVLEEIAATAEQVKSTANTQVKSSEDLNREAERLSVQSAELQNAISSFTID